MNVIYHSSIVHTTVITLLAALDVLVLQDIFFKGMAKPVKVRIHQFYFFALKPNCRECSWLVDVAVAFSSNTRSSVGRLR